MGILIIEDNTYMAEAIQDILEAEGYQGVSNVPSGEQALSWLLDHRPDVILMDFTLAGELDGVETAAAIKQRYDIPIIFITAHTDTATWQRARAVKPHGFLIKPFHSEDLLHVIELALYMHRAETSLREREAYYRSLFEGAHDAILIYALDDQTVLDLNERACQVYGYSRAEFIGKALAQIALPPAEAPPLLDDGNASSIVHHQRRDGQRIILETRASPITYQGRPAMLSINRDVTRRVEQEAELDRYRRRLERQVDEDADRLNLANEQIRLQITALAAAANGILITDRAGKIVWANPALSQMTGFTMEELLGRTPAMLGAEGEPALMSGEMWRAIQAGKTWKSEMVSRRKDGSPFNAELIVTPVRNEAGEICNFVAVSQDITERILADRALRESEGRYRKMLESSPLVITTFDSEFITYINPAGARLLGIERPEEIIGRPVSQVMDPANFRELAELFSGRMLSADQPLSKAGMRFVRPNGEQVFLDLSAASIHESAPSQVQVIAQDVTERKRAQENLYRQAALAEVELAINQPSELAEVLSRVVESATRMLNASAGASVLFVDHRTGNLLVGSSNVISTMRNQLTGGHIKQNRISRWILQNKQPFIIPDTRLTAPGTDLLVSSEQIRAFIGVPLLMEDQAIGLLYVIDSHPREYSREDIEFLTALANRAALAIAKVEVFQSLEEAKEAAEAAARAKSAFLANMSHELRTPLTAIIGLAELLADSQINSQQAEFVATIKSSANRLLYLIGNVLDISRLEAARFTLETRRFDLHQVIDGALDMLALQAARKNLRLLCRVASEVPAWVVGDDGRLAQVLTNLITNAVKFTEAGSIRLEVGLGPRQETSLGQDPSQEQAVTLTFSVRDTGQGIPPERQGQLFQAFSQVDSSTSRKHSGTGLGLAISKQLVELMGGEIHLTSSGVPGEGCEFAFTIQVQSAADLCPAYLEKNPPGLAGQRVLLVESFAPHRAILEEQLSAWGMQALTAGDAAETLAVFDTGFSPAIVLISCTDLETWSAGQVEALIGAAASSKTALLLALQAGQALPARLAGCASLKLPASAARLFDLLQQALEAPAPSEDAPAPAAGQAGPLAGSRPAILLADDDPINRHVLSLILENLGYEVQAVANGLQALQALESRSFPVVIMDQQMPEMDGLSAILYIRQMFSPQEQPFILALTADARNETRQMLREAGAQAALSKPVTKDALAESLRQAFQSGGRGYATGGLRPAHVSRIKEDYLSDLFDSLGPGSVQTQLEVLDLFFQNTPHLIGEIQAQAAQANTAALLAALHSLKGSCELYGASGLAELCRNLDQDLRSGAQIDLAQRIVEIHQEYSGVDAHLAAIYNQLKESPAPDRRPLPAETASAGLAGR